MDTLSLLLTRFPISAGVFYTGRICGVHPFAADRARAHLHLIERGPVDLVDADGTSTRFERPTVLFLPRPEQHRIVADDGVGAQVLCATVQFGANSTNNEAGLPGGRLCQQQRLHAGLHPAGGHESGALAQDNGGNHRGRDTAPGKDSLMSSSFDLVVIGSGTAATAAANRVRKAGWSVAVIEHRALGGTCALRGCDPKKMLVGGAEALDHARRMDGRGVDGTLRIAWPDLMAFKRSFTDAIPAQREQAFRDKDIAIFRGKARFTGPDTLEVGGQRLKARHVLIASGAEPARLDIGGAEHLSTSDDFLGLPSLPARIVLVGGGYIAAEISHIAARAGGQVTVLQHGPRMLKGFDAELVGWLMEKFHALGIDVRTGTSVQALQKTGDAITVMATSDQGESRIEADLVVHAAGRVPALGDLDLDAAGIATEHGRLKLNEFLQSVSNPRVYAAGDAAQVGPPLTPVSSLDAQVVADNLLQGNHRRPDYRGIPSVAFSIPPIAMVGLGEEEATKRGLKFRKRSARAASWFTALQAAEPVYGYKVLVDEASDEILGAHLVGPHVEETINLFALAIRHRIKASDLKASVFAYPTGASDISYML